MNFIHGFHHPKTDRIGRFSTAPSMCLLPMWFSVRQLRLLGVIKPVDCGKVTGNPANPADETGTAGRAIPAKNSVVTAGVALVHRKVNPRIAHVAGGHPP